MVERHANPFSQQRVVQIVPLFTMSLLSRATSCVLRHGRQTALRSYTTHSQLPEEHKMVYEMCRKFADEELAPNAGKWDKDHAFPTDAITQLAELGMMGINTRGEYNGSELDALSYAIAMEEVSRGCASVGVIMSAHNSLYLYPIQAFGTPEQQEQWVAPYAACVSDEGLKVGCFGLSEPGNGSDAGAASTTATLDGDEWIINGTKGT